MTSVVVVASVVLLLVSLYSIQDGFDSIAVEAKEVQTSVLALSESLSQNQQQLTQTEAALLDANKKLLEADRRLKILSKKTITLDGDISVLMEDLNWTLSSSFKNSTSNTLDSSSTLDALENTLDEIGEIKTSLRRDTLINVESAVSTMGESVALLAIQQNDLEKVRQGMKMSSSDLATMSETTQSMLTSSDQFGASIALQVKLIMGFSLLLVIVVTLTGFALRRMILTPLKLTQRTLLDAEREGDLTVELVLSNEGEFTDISNSFNSFAAKLRSILLEVDASTLGLNVAAHQTYELSVKGQKIVNQSSEDIESIVAAVTEMAASAESVASNADDSANRTQVVDSELEDGRKIIGCAIKEVYQLAEYIKSAETLMAKLLVKSQNIGQVVEVIRDVSEQTNLLSLNAAIEAARAGELGRGFAVVADEVRTLATKSAESTQEIQDIVEEIQKYCDSTAETMRHCRENSDTAVSEAQNAESALSRINQSVHEISEMIISIATAAEEQASVCHSIESSVVELNNLSHESVACSKESERVAGDLEAMSKNLKVKVAQVKVR